MKPAKLMMFIFMLLLVAGFASAATLHGKIYDIELNELNDVIVEVDSSPQQRFVSKDGGYSFELNPGKYTVTANYSPDPAHKYSTLEQVTISEEGEFVYDLFLFPGFDAEDENMLEEEDIIDVPETVIDEKAGMSGVTIAIIVVAAVILLLILYYFFGCRKKEELEEEIEEVEKIGEHAKKSLKEEMQNADVRNHKHTIKQKKQAKIDSNHADLNNVIEIIKKEGGRTTQKELRKQIPLSEAKISLMISELEHKKVVQKVKKGRGNVILLKKK